MPLNLPQVGGGGGAEIGGDVSGGTEGSVLFVGSGAVLAQDNTNFYWDDTENQLLLGNGTDANPSYSFRNRPGSGMRTHGNDVRLVHNGALHIRLTGAVSYINNQSSPTTDPGHWFNSVSITATSGTPVFGRFQATFAPTSGSAQFIGLDIAPTINQTGSASGNYTAFRIAVTETSAAGSDNRLIDAQVDGSSVFYMTSAGLVRGPDGSAASPAFSFLNDTNTGMYSAGADILGFAAGGAATLQINPTGLGVSMSPTTAKLALYDNSGSANYLLYGNKDNAAGTWALWAMARQGAIKWQLGIDSSDRFTVWAGATGAAFSFSAAVGQVLFDDGTTSAPSLSFVNDTNTGIYRFGADVLSVSCGGVEVARFQQNVLNLASGGGFYISSANALQRPSAGTLAIGEGFTTVTHRVTSGNTVLSRDDDGNWTWTPEAATSGTPIHWTLTGAAHTGINPGTADVSIDLARTVQFDTSIIDTFNQWAFEINAPTYASTGASTITDAATLYISGAPSAGTNVTITNAYALWVDDGNVRIDGSIVGSLGATLANSSNGYWTTNGGYIANAANGFRAPGSFEFAGSSALLRIDATGSGAELRLINSSGSGSITFWTTNTLHATINSRGNWTWTPSAATSGSPTLWTLTAPAHTGLTASTEATDVFLNLGRTVQFANGDLALQRAIRIDAPDYTFAGSTTIPVITDAVTLWIEGGPTFSGDANITNSWALYVNSGKTFFGGEVEIDGALNHDGTQIGFFGTSPTLQRGPYTPTNVTTDRSFDADFITVEELADVVGTMIFDLQAYGLFS